MFALLIATLWLFASIAGGMWLITGVKTGPVHLRATAPSIDTSVWRSVYGGDAYTGIQNAAADTAKAVVDGTNGLAAFSQELADSNATTSRDLANRTQQGLGMIIIGIGVLTFTVALRHRDAG